MKSTERKPRSKYRPYDIEEDNGWYYCTVCLTQLEAKICNSIIEAGLFPSRSEFIRYCMNRYGLEVLELYKNIDKFEPEILKVLL